ncbi:hypothetical protein, partial [Nocardiopsis salina]|uniref:hypothetical protein n=1 Tax=Nocardiopsis salina TaxID=245836 RepID=UPI0003704803
MSAPSAPLTPVPPGHGIVLDPATRLADEGHLLVGGRPTGVVQLSSPQVSLLLCWMSGATPDAPGARALAARLVAAGLARPAPPPPGEPDEGDSGDDDVLVLVAAGVCPEPRWLTRALAHLEDPRVGAVVPGAVVDEQDRQDAGPLRAGLAALLTRLILPETIGAAEAPGGQAVEHSCDDPPRLVPALVVRHSALPAPGAAPPAPKADTARLPPAGVLSRTLPATLPGALVAAGWSVRHEPRSRVRVGSLRGFGAYLSVSFELGAAAGEDPGPVAGGGERRGGATPARAAGPRVSWTGLAALALVLAGRPVGGVC